MPASRFRNPRTTVALGVAYAQLKTIQGLPAGGSKLLSQIVRENATAFFLGTIHRLVVSDVECRPDGSAWAAAFNGTLVDSLLSALRTIGISNVRIVTRVAAVAQLLPPGRHFIHEGDGAVEVTITDERCIESCHRIRPSGEPPPPIELPPGLGIETSSWEFGAAVGATMYARHGALAWTPPVDANRRRRRQQSRLAGSFALFAISMCAAVLAPSVRAMLASNRSLRELDRTREALVHAPRLEQELRSVTADLERIASFQSARGRVTMLLGAISQALPESTALVSLRLEEREGSLVTLTPRAADVLPQLVEVDGIVAPRIVGSVTREMQAGSRVERATIRFRRPRDIR